MKKLALIVFLAAAMPGVAQAKGPSEASIAGPGVPTIEISGGEGSSTPFWRLVEAAGWFEAAWGPSPLPQKPPQGELGPRYTIAWTVPSSSTLHQDVYPYAKPFPVTSMPRGQKIYGTPVRGGWFRGGAKLRTALVRVGLPAQAPEPPPADGPKAARSPGSDHSALAAAAIAAGALILFLVLVLGVRARRGPRPLAG